MLGIVTLLVVIVVSLLVTRIATVALVLTGLSREAARFQARSAFSGVGFTTTEAEAVVGHPVRRRIVMTLMLLGSAGIVGAVAALMLSFLQAGGRETATRLLVLAVGLAVLWVLAHSRLVDRALTALIQRGLERWTDLNVRDYAALLHLAGDYAVTELAVEDGEWLADKTLTQLALRDEGVSVLGVERADGSYVGGPIGHTPLRVGDRLIVYGRVERVREVDHRPAGPEGDAAHERAVRDHHERVLADAEGNDNPHVRARRPAK
ncbi:MAG: TrkA C-terminal domain-containing protein [Thermoleophilia bacterium]|nr:TrkA C-terminal domain-containing protein [Thermoleophilia bacterium]